MPAILYQAGNRGWPAFEGLLRGMLRFLEPYLRNAQLTASVRDLYKVCQQQPGREQSLILPFSTFRSASGQRELTPPRRSPLSDRLKAPELRRSVAQAIIAVGSGVTQDAPCPDIVLGMQQC